MRTTSIIEPPVRNGGSSLRCFEYTAPTPLGPHILWPENAAKSTSKAWKSTGMCGTDWHASSTVTAPTAFARRTISSTSACAPVTFDWWVKATTLTDSSNSSESRSIRPSSVILYHFSVAPVRRASSCHGTRFAWCSSSVTTMVSSAPTASEPARESPSTYATRLSASVAFFVNAISSFTAPTNDAIASRADSYASVASSASWYEPRCTGALHPSTKSRSASHTRCGRCDVAPESK